MLSKGERHEFPAEGQSSRLHLYLDVLTQCIDGESKGHPVLTLQLGMRTNLTSLLVHFDCAPHFTSAL